MSVAAIMLIAQLGAIAPTIAPVTPATVTALAYDVDCRMTDIGGNPFELGFEQTGGRGYSRSAIRPDERGVDYTPVRTVVTKDTSGRYANDELWTSGQPAWPGVKQTLPKAGYAFQTEFVSYQTSKADQVLLHVLPRFPLGAVSAFGICTVKSQVQTPLSDEEARRQFRK